MKKVLIVALAHIEGLTAADGSKQNLETGKTCECDEKTAAWAVDNGFAELAEKAEEAPADPVVTLEAFKAAVAQLDAGNEQHFTNSGKPDCGALSDVGCKVSAAERDTFWQELNPA